MVGFPTKETPLTSKKKTTNRHLQAPGNLPGLGSPVNSRRKSHPNSASSSEALPSKKRPPEGEGVGDRSRKSFLLEKMLAKRNKKGKEEGGKRRKKNLATTRKKERRHGGKESSQKDKKRERAEGGA